MDRERATSESRWVVRCTRCGDELSPLAQTCPRCPDALPRSHYAETRFVVSDHANLFRFATWLPPRESVDTSVGPCVVKSMKLAAVLGLDDLWIGFNGYAPEWGAVNPTGTFKDFEALPTLLLLREHGRKIVVLASAGNTARAFVHAAVTLNFQTILVVPEALAPTVWSPYEETPVVRLVAVRGGDYTAAISVANALAERCGFASEGGARNVARRDGMGTAVLEFARVVGRLPDHYVQAVGSGTGGIAAWEASLRLRASGAFPQPLPRLHLAQNAPFTPIHDAWTAGRPIEPDRDIADQVRRIAAMCAPVLANRRPPFALTGGVRDALRDTQGRTYSVDNAAIDSAQALFHSVEGVSIGPESGAALAALQQGVARGWVSRRDSILLHVTGNGDALLRHATPLHPVRAWMTVDVGDAIERCVGALRREFSL